MAANEANGDVARFYSIGEVLALLRVDFDDITISKIRFLESQGLLEPERTPSGYRRFYDHDIERLRWILRQQREHFLPLKVIKARLRDADRAADAAGRPRGAPGHDLTDESSAPQLPLGAATDASRRPRARSGRTGSHPVVGMAPPPPAVPAPAPSPAGSPPPVPAAAAPAPPTRPLAAPAVTAAAAASAPVAAAPVAPAVVDAAPDVARVLPEPALFAARSRSLPPPAVARTPAGGGVAAAGDGRPGPGGSSSPAAGTVGATPAPAPPERPAPAAVVAPTVPRDLVPGVGSPPATGAVAAGRDLVAITLTLQELAQAAGVEPSVVRELERFDLLAGTDTPSGRTYDEHGLAVARAAAALLQQGVEARHLRMYLVALEREIAVFEQLLVAERRLRGDEGRRARRARLSALVDDGEALRRALLRRLLDDLA